MGANRVTQNSVRKSGDTMTGELEITSGGLTVGNGSSNSSALLTINSERAWQLYASGTGATTKLDLKTLNDGYQFRIITQGGATMASFNVNNNQASSLLTVNAPAVFNEGGVDADFRVEGDNNTSLIHADASSDRVGINESAPDYKLDVNGSFGFTPGTSVTPTDNGDVVIEATNDTTLTFKLKGSDGTIRSATLTLS